MVWVPDKCLKSDPCRRKMPSSKHLSKYSVKSCLLFPLGVVGVACVYYVSVHMLMCMCEYRPQVHMYSPQSSPDF